MKIRALALAAMIAVLIGACGTPFVATVSDGTYRALVPTADQLASEQASDLPGGFALLSESGIDSVAVVVSGDEVTIQSEGGDSITRQVTERLVVQDSEGSGPFKAEKEVLMLGPEPLTLGELTIPEPVIWPGSFEDSPVITIKQYTETERGPVVSCTQDEMCLLLTSGTDPIGRYEGANNPDLNENPIASIEVSAAVIEFTLDSGAIVELSRTGEGTTNACGLAETLIWDVPAELALTIDDAVLVEASCPTTPGDSYLIILDRSRVPILAPLGDEFGGEWCSPGPACLLFVPTD
ncbi:MAG: hypothetical protein HKN91_06185 [Acidimicrobiia bacterium]|nr:hypothetical protein [Acidimicrobiia bacterium]